MNLFALVLLYWLIPGTSKQDIPFLLLLFHSHIPQLYLFKGPVDSNGGLHRKSYLKKYIYIFDTSYVLIVFVSSEIYINYIIKKNTFTYYYNTWACFVVSLSLSLVKKSKYCSQSLFGIKPEEDMKGFLVLTAGPL